MLVQRRAESNTTAAGNIQNKKSIHPYIHMKSLKIVDRIKESRAEKLIMYPIYLQRRYYTYYRCLGQ